MGSDDSEYVLDAPDRGWNHEPSRAELFKQIKSPAYTTDADGWLTYYNEAAADLWGYRPELGKTRWCGSWRIFTTEGAHLPLDQCPMAVALKEGRAVRGVQAVVERPDGTLIPFLPHPTPLRDASGAIVAGSNVLLPLTAQGSVLPPFDYSGDDWTEALPPDLPDSLELDDLTGCLQRTLAAQADVEFGFQIDCERLEAWSSSEAEKEHIVRQLESKRERQRTLLNKRLDQLQQRAKRLMAEAQEGKGTARMIVDPRNTLH
ncbi:PAS domain-containing protein [Methylobacterium durans]|uniref:Histidine kinase n=1 Tax=Methylobacterium durans TaxID=2202825 RepID=A0A2U8W227_9HYPH|nr:PAS domain-containing protein [Methylobacterium durans]AWN40129.1 histidine kinase [Methylobacterium durans]